MSDVDTILKRLVADIDDAMEMQGTRWSSNERVAGLVQEALEQATRLIQVLYASEMSSLDQEIVSLKAEIKRLQERKQTDLSKFDIKDKRKLLRNAVEPEVGHEILLASQKSTGQGVLL